MIVVVGAECRKAGKTRLICELIRATPEIAWTAVKISPHRHSGAPPPHPDSDRFLEAGARYSHFLESTTPAQALAFLRPLLAARVPLLIESTSILDTLTGELSPDLAIMVTDPQHREPKESAQHFAPRASAVVCFTESADRNAKMIAELVRLLRAPLARRVESRA